jgi:hypothetical protein
MYTIIELLWWIGAFGHMNRGIWKAIGPFLHHCTSGLKRSSLHPYDYFFQRLSSSSQVSDTPSLKPPFEYVAQRTIYPRICTRKAMSKSSGTFDSDKIFSCLSVGDECGILDGLPPEEGLVADERSDLAVCASCEVISIPSHTNKKTHSFDTASSTLSCFCIDKMLLHDPYKYASPNVFVIWTRHDA